MRGIALTRMRLALATALVSAAASAGLIAISESAEADGAKGLLPDLVTLAPDGSDLVVIKERGRRLLRMTTEFANRGEGPLEIFPSAESGNCDGDGNPDNDRDASQRTFADTDGDGGFSAGVDGILTERRVGCMRYHAVHDHWHVLDFARYELRREPRGRLVAKRRKVGFCVGDNRRAFPKDPRTPPKGVYPFGPPGSIGCDAMATQGVSIGWTDLYLYWVPGQELRVGGLPRGRYCLVMLADPRDLIDERNEDNNVRRTPIMLDPKRLTVNRLRGKCRT